MPPKRTSAAAVAAAAAAPMTDVGTEGVDVLAQWFERMESVFHISNCDVENQVKFATCTFLGNALTWVFHKESKEVEKYVGGLPDMIRGNKRKLEFNVGNSQGYQQQNKRQNTGRAYTAGPGEKREYTRSLPLCTKCNYHHKGPCAPRCNKCKKVGHLARDWELQEGLPEVEEWKP
ncbi:hypothetical protein Tco_1325526, partial [Tanacetum coccineum]